MESAVKGINEGYRNDSVGTSSTVKVDLSAWAGRYVKIYSDQDLYFCFFKNGTEGDLVVSGSVAVGTKGVADSVGAGYPGVQRMVSVEEPWVYLRAISAAAKVVIKPTSDVVGV